MNIKQIISTHLIKQTTEQQRRAATNSTYKKLAVLCYVETFLVYGNLVLRNYIRGDWRQLLVAANRYAPF